MNPSIFVRIIFVGVGLFLIAGGKPNGIITIAGVGTIITAFFYGSTN